MRINETCACGASVQVATDGPMDAVYASRFVDEFRKEHRECTPTVKVKPSDPGIGVAERRQ